MSMENRKTRSYEEAFLYAMGESETSDRNKKRSLLYAEYYDAVPVALTDEDGNEVDVVLSPSRIQELESMIAKRQNLTVSRPLQEISPVDAFPTRDTVHTIGENGSLSRYLNQHQYIELSKEMTHTLNEDWEIKPHYRHVAARALIGSVIIDTANRRGLLILSLELYGRDPTLDLHAELRSTVSSTHQSTSVPPPNNNDIYISTLHQAEGKNISMKLIIGTHPFNALVTSSIRIDNVVDQPECGPNTVNFFVAPQTNLNYKLYIDSQSWSDSQLLANIPDLNSIYTHSRLMQLRQLKTRFDDIGTYSASRSNLFHGYLQQPVTVFTYCKSTTSMNSAVLCSKFLASLATSVIRDGFNARLQKSSVEQLLSQFTKDTKAKGVFRKILELFSDADSMAIIGNTGLNSCAEDMASLLASYVSTANKKSVIPALVDHLRSY